jgi:hypothetical protein
MIIRFRFFHKKYAAMTIWPFIFVKKEIYKLDKLMINHERIHLSQQLELLIIPFFIWYIFEFLIKLIRYKKWDIAYRAISFEKEAYQNESNSQYIENRKPWSFLKYL